MDNTLTIQLAFFAAAVPVALEAYKAQNIARIVLWSVALGFAAAGFLWPWLGASLPVVAENIGRLATDPVTWFVLAVAVFFVIRPMWTGRPPNAEIGVSNEQRDIKAVTDLEGRVLPAIAGVHKELTERLDALGRSQSALSDNVQLLLKERIQAQARDFLSKAKKWDLENPDGTGPEHYALRLPREISFMPNTHPAICLTAEERAEIEAAEQRVRSDASFCTLGKGDERFPNGKFKQQWHIRKAHIQKLIEIVRRKAQ